MTTLQDYNGFIVFGGTWCGFCRKAKKILDSNNLFYIWNEVSNDDGEKTELKKDLETLTDGHTTFPMIFFDKKFIGGSDKIKDFIEQMTDEEKSRRYVEKKKIGGISEAKEPDDSTVKLCERFRKTLEEKYGSFTMYKCLNYKTQLVNGVNCFVKIQTDEKKSVHVRFHRFFEKDFVYVRSQYPKNIDDPIEYF